MFRRFTKNLSLLAILLFAVLSTKQLLAQKMPPSFEESKKSPVKYVGTTQTDKHFYDGRLRHAVGVHSRQIFRANRTDPTEGGIIGWTYNHAPMLAYWNDQFFIQYLSNLKEEHGMPGRTLLVTSKDGMDWSNPKVLFPIFPLPKIDNEYGKLPAGSPAIPHQRMGFYVAPNGRLLTVSFISYCQTQRDSPNRGQGLGRLIREIYKDGTFGPIYFIKYNPAAGWNETNVPNYSFYKTSPDKAFIQACDALLADQLVTLQWWEMDRTTDGFYNIDPGDKVTKALCYYHRPDNVVVALWKSNLSALSADNGTTWSPITSTTGLKTCNAKVWGQRTEDGKYSLVYNHSATRRNRFPLVVLTGEDGHEFSNMLCVSGEVPPTRYQGIHKPPGLQYTRGIVEGNGNPPGNQQWVTYSVNKEDIWASRINVPVIGSVPENVEQNFENVSSVADLKYWNLYIPKWAPIQLSSDPLEPGNTCLLLRDEEPCDYGKAEKAFPESKEITVEFDLQLKKVGAAKLEIEVLDKAGTRPMRLRISDQWIMLDRGRLEIRPVPITLGQWFHIKLELDCNKQSYDLSVNGKLAKQEIPFEEKVETLERIEFRTGPWRLDVRPFILEGTPGNPGLYIEDLPGADHKMSLSEYLIDNVKTE